MKWYKLAFLYGFLVWLIIFVIAVLIFPLRNADRLFFESIMPVVVALTVVIFSSLYFRKVEKNFLKEGILLGIVWFLISVAVDLLMFMQGPMEMTFVDYMKDVGFTYLIIPIITTGLGYLIEKKQ